MFKAFETPLEKLGLSTRTYNALRRAGYETVEQVYDETDDVLSRKRDIGKAAMSEIAYALEEWDKAVMSDV